MWLRRVFFFNIFVWGHWTTYDISIDWITAMRQILIVGFPFVVTISTCLHSDNRTDTILLHQYCPQTPVVRQGKHLVQGQLAPIRSRDSMCSCRLYWATQISRFTNPETCRFLWPEAPVCLLLVSESGSHLSQTGGQHAVCGRGRPHHHHGPPRLTDPSMTTLIIIIVIQY